MKNFISTPQIRKSFKVVNSPYLHVSACHVRQPLRRIAEDCEGFINWSYNWIHLSNSLSIRPFSILPIIEFLLFGCIFRLGWSAVYHFYAQQTEHCTPSREIWVVTRQVCTLMCFCTPDFRLCMPITPSIWGMHAEDLLQNCHPF